MAELKEGQEFTVTAQLETAAGHAATYERGSARWESSDGDVASVEVNPENELEATVRGLDGSANGAVVISLHLDGDPEADETREIVGSLDVVVTTGEAHVISLAAGTPTDTE